MLLLAHAPLASAFALVARDMGLATPALMAIDITPSMTRDLAYDTVMTTLGAHQVEDCLILVDVGGASSPATVARRARDTYLGRVRVVTGLNSAMLMTAVCYSHLPVDELARRAAQRGCDDIDPSRAQAAPAAG